MQMHSHTLNTQHASFTNGLRQPGLAARVASVPARLCMHLNASSSSPGSTTEDAERLKQRIRRVRLFRSTDSTDGDAPAAAAAAAQPAAEAARPVPVSEEFRQAFEDLGVQPIGVKNLGQVSRVWAFRAARACTKRNSHPLHPQLSIPYAPWLLRTLLYVIINLFSFCEACLHWWRCGRPRCSCWTRSCTHLCCCCTQ